MRGKPKLLRKGRWSEENWRRGERQMVVKKRKLKTGREDCGDSSLRIMEEVIQRKPMVWRIPVLRKWLG